MDGQKSYRLIIAPDVQEKFDLLHARFPRNEWSGTLFYTAEGTFEDNNLVLRVVDFFLQDIGSGAFTEFVQSPDVATYIAENMHLAECNQGLVHSHNSMGAFFSGTDQDTLLKEGIDRVHFLSLVVNIKNEPVARITRKIKTQSFISKKQSWLSFGRRPVNIENETIQELDVVEYFDLNIEVEKVKGSYPELEARIEELLEIERRKPVRVAGFGGYQGWSQRDYETGGFWGGEPELPFGNQGGWLEKEKERELEERREKSATARAESSIATEYGNTGPSDDQVNRIVLKLITGAVAPIGDVSEHLPGMILDFNRRFINFDAFKKFAIGHIDLLLYANKQWYNANFYNDDEKIALTAYMIKQALENLKVPMNKYIEYYIELLDSYII